MGLRKTAEAVGKRIRWVIALGLSAYIIAYTSVHNSAVEDYHKHHRQNLAGGLAKNTLLVEDYIAEIDNRKRCLTIYGETHNYNLNEHRVALELLKKYPRVHFESGTVENMHLKMTRKNMLFGELIFRHLRLSTYYFRLATGRTCPNLSETAHGHGKPVHELEDPNLFYDTASRFFIAELAVSAVISSFSAPWMYEMFKPLAGISPEIDMNVPESIAENMLRNRDPVMAGTIAGALRSEGHEPILAGFGLLHYKGVMMHLERDERVKLQRVTSLEECIERLYTCRKKSSYY